MKAFPNKVLALVESYREELARYGIEILLSERRVETDVKSRSGSVDSRHALLKALENASDHRKEVKKGYRFAKNRYDSLVLKVVPLEKTLVDKEECCEYAFVVRKIERAHLGDEPKENTYQEAVLLEKIEKRVVKILKKAGCRSAEKFCKNTLWDAFRYSFSNKYEYKSKFCRKDRDFWEMLFLFSTVAVGFFILLLTWVVTR